MKIRGAGWGKRARKLTSTKVRGWAGQGSLIFHGAGRGAHPCYIYSISYYKNDIFDYQEYCGICVSLINVYPSPPSSSANEQPRWCDIQYMGAAWNSRYSQQKWPRLSGNNTFNLSTTTGALYQSVFFFLFFHAPQSRIVTIAMNRSSNPTNTQWGATDELPNNSTRPNNHNSKKLHVIFPAQPWQI